MHMIERVALVATFMGFKEPKRFDEGWIPPASFEPTAPPYEGYSLNQMLFYNSWDWLMPVVIKMVDTLEYNEFKGKTGYEHPYMEGNPLYIFSSKIKYDVNFTREELFEHIVEFIEWYNEIEIK